MLQYPDELIAGQTFNVGYENHTVSQLAQITKSVVESEYSGRETIRIETTPSNDNRSYHVSSRKIAERLGYRPIRTIEDAVHDLCGAFRANRFRDSLSNEEYVNVKTIKALGLT
jgi:nucleoside-diphosphate-sugar epimerase